MINTIAKVVEWLGMAPEGIVGGALGALLSIVVRNNNSLDFRKGLAIFLCGTALGGYGMRILKDMMGGWSEGWYAFLTAVIGGIAADLMTSIVAVGPTFTNGVVKAVVNMLKKWIGDDEK